ncbi:MAG: response regulator [Gemmatimonadaceae bacterium]
MTKPPRILVVDDGHDAADSLCMVLRMFGADSNVVYDGQSALDSIRNSKPDIVLLDLSMPGMDGYTVAKNVRANPECDDVRLIALTGWGTEEERVRSEAAGFTDHWVKPVPAATLRKLVSTELEKNAP